MRNPANEALTLPDTESGGGRRKTEPVRTCILTRKAGSPAALIRLALSPDGEVLPDVAGKAPGRGAWIGVDRTVLEAAIVKGRLKGALARAFKGERAVPPADLPERIAAALERRALDRLGLEARAGHLLTGAERIENAARSGQVHALYHAADAGDDGTRRLAQAWRVGEGEEGSERRGVALPIARPILSLALGRENVVHIAVTDRAAAARVSEALSRWLRYIGFESLSAPGGSAPHGVPTPGSAAVSTLLTCPTTDEDPE